MDKIVTTEDIYLENKIIQENLLLDIINEVCTDPNSNLPPQLVAKVNKILDDCDLSQHTSLHKLHTVNKSSSSILGVTEDRGTELSYKETVLLNEAIVNKIQYIMPRFLAELGRLRQSIGSGKKSRTNEIKELEDSLKEKISTLNAQEEEKIELMMQWLNHRLQEVSTFNNSSYDLLTLKTRVLELKSQILHLQILRNVFTETNQSMKAFSEIGRQIREGVRQRRENIATFNNIINEDYE